MKRKMGLRNLLSRSNKHTQSGSVDSPSTELSDARDSIDEPLHFPANNAFIRRPPPLDASVERELRVACEGILKDLKPSGHDIEDRRMKTDILVEDDPYKFNHKVQAIAQHDSAKAKRQHSAAAWVMDENTGEVEHQSRVPDVVRSPELARRQFPAAVSVPPANDLVETKSSPTTADALMATEMPLAPLPTNTSGTRQPSMAASTYHISNPHSSRRADSASTNASTPFTPSTEHYRSASTAPTSAAVTSAGSSNRASDNVYVQPASAQDGEWMKQEVEKHKQNQGSIPSIAATAGAAGVLAAEAPSKGTSIKDKAPSQEGRSMSLTSQSGINAMKRPTITSRSSSRHSTTVSIGQPIPMSPTLGTNPMIRQGSTGSTGSKRHSRSSNRLSIDGVPEARFSPQPSPRPEDVPPVPRLDADRLNSLTNASRNNSVTQVANAEAQRQPGSTAKATQPSQMQVRPAGSDLKAQTTNGTSTRNLDLRDQTNAGRRHVPPTNNSITSAHNPPSIDTTIANSRNPSTAKNTNHTISHQQDKSVLVRDFYKPSNLGPNFRRINPHDPTPADFDALMSAMDGAVHGPVDQQAISPPVITETSPQDSQGHSQPVGANGSYFPRGNSGYSSSHYSARSGQPPTMSSVSPPVNREQSVTSASSVPSPPPQSNGVAAEIRAAQAPEATTTIHDVSVAPQSPPAQSSPSIQQSRPTSVVSPSRNSEAYSQRSSATSGKKMKGLPKLLWKLGGGDMPQRRKIYIPPQSQDNQAVPHSQEDAYDWDDEEACAAPVVGFGRGW